MADARPNVAVDDDRVRVTTWTFEAPGDATGWHRHEFDYLVVPVTGGTFKVVEPDGCEREMEQVAGAPYAGRVGTEHDVIDAPTGRRCSSRSS